MRLFIAALLVAISYAQTVACTIDADCNGPSRAKSVTGNVGSCKCDCREGWLGKTCDDMIRYWTDDACETETNGWGDDAIGQYRQPLDNVLEQVSCCSKDGSTCTSRNCDGWGLSLKQAEKYCADQGKRLCTREELASGVCCGTGCDDSAVWSSTKITNGPDQCEEDDTWRDWWGDSCEWYEKQIERCDVVGDVNSQAESVHSLRRNHLTECCYCRPGPKGGPAANEGRSCTAEKENEIAGVDEGKYWMVDLGLNEPYYLDCHFFEAKLSRCRTSWGSEPGSNGKSAKEVCCVCQFGRVVHIWGKNVNTDGSLVDRSNRFVKSEERAVGIPGLIDPGNSDGSDNSAETQLARQNKLLRKTNKALKEALGALAN